MGCGNVGIEDKITSDRIIFYILKVYEEKERSWERELRKIKALYENRMKANQQKVKTMLSMTPNHVDMVLIAGK